MSNPKDIITNYIDNRLSKESLYSVVATVSSVSLNAKICTVEALTGETIEDVRLETDLALNAAGDIIKKDPSGVLMVPEVGSVVVVSFLSKSEAFISMFSTISDVYIISDLTTFNDGDNGGLINISDITQKLNNLVNELSAELIKIQTGIVGAGGAYTPGSLSQFDTDDFEDDKIVH